MLLCVCIAVDSADDTISNMNETKAPAEFTNKNLTFVNGTYYITQKNPGKAISDGKTHTVKEKKQKKKTPTVTITARPSCGCRYSYQWRTNRFVDYCPHCHHRNCLRNVHKWQAHYEQELTCTVCGADYCGQCGKEKYSWSRYYIKKI